MSTEPEYVEIPFVYIGRGTTANGEKGGKIISLELLQSCTSRQQAEQISSFFVFKERELPRAVGWVYTIKAKLDDDGRITNIRGNHHLDGDQRKHKINAEWVAHWQATETAFRVAERSRKVEAKYDRNELRERLKPLQFDYGKTDAIGRLALEVVVLSILRGQSS